MKVKENPMYCVLMGDIIDSRNLEYSRREEIAKTMQELFDEINVEYMNDILAGFGLVRGDAFEGVLFSQYKAPIIIQRIIQTLYNKEKIKVRISAVLDELSVVSVDRNKADGPAFYQALNKLELLRSKKSNHWLQVYIATDTRVQPLVDSVLDLLSALTEEWTDKQRELVWAMPEFSNQQKLLSQNMKINQSVVNKQLKAAHYQTYYTAWKNLELFLTMSEDSLMKSSDIEMNKRISYTTYYSIASRQSDNHNYNEASMNYEKALELAKKIFGPYNTNLLPIYIGLTESYTEMIAEIDKSGLKEKLVHYILELIAEAKKCFVNLQKTNLEYARVLNVEGNLNIQLGDFTNALKCYEKALDVSKKACEAYHPFYFVCYNNIGIAYRNMDQYKKALSYYKMCSEYEKERDPKNYANTLFNMYLCYLKMSDFEQARNCLVASIEILKNYLPANDRELIEKRQLAVGLTEELKGEQ